MLRRTSRRKPRKEPSFFRIGLATGTRCCSRIPRITPVCTTELGYMAGLQPEFAKRNTKILGLSVDPVTSHSKWASDIQEVRHRTQGTGNRASNLEVAPGVRF